MIKHFKYLFIFLVFNLSAQDYPVEYQNQLQAAQDKYHVLSNLPGNDVVIHPIETVPVILSYNETPSNYAKELYDIEYSIPKRKGISFILDTEGEITHKDSQEGYRADLSISFTGEQSLGGVNGHGIHCDGIIASKKEGLMYEYIRNGYFEHAVVKVLRDNGTGSFDNIMEGVDYVYELAPKLQAQGYVVGISLSLGGSGNFPPINALLAKCKAIGIIVTAASGNDNGPVGTPANADGASAVGSIYKDFNKSWFSNYGPELYSVSFGQEINSTYINNTYRVLNGTSMACPNQHAYSMWQAMHSTEIPTYVVDNSGFRDLGTKGFDNYYGNGLTISDGYVPPKPPENDSITMYHMPIKEEYKLVYGQNIFDQTPFYVTEIDITLRSKLISEDALASMMIPLRKFFRARGFVVRPGDDFDEAVAITWFFLDMFMAREDLVFEIHSMTAMTEEGYPLKIYAPFVNKSLGEKISDLAHGILIYEYR